jgi:hypothetical protein
LSNPTHKTIISRRAVLFLFVGGAIALFCILKPDRGSEFVVRGRTVSYTYYDGPTAPKGWKPKAGLEFSFTNPTPNSIWFMRFPSFLSETSESTPVMVRERRKTVNEYWHEKTSRFPQGLKTSWSLWSSDIFGTNLSSMWTVHELRPNESLKLRVAGFLGQPQRIGVICRDTATNEWIVRWSEVITPSR